MTISQVFGFVGTGLVVLGYVPQIVHLVKERCTVGISIPAFALWSSASFLFLIHAVMIGDAVFIGVQTVNFVAGTFIVWLSKRYAGQVCPFHLDAHSSFGKRTV